MSMSPPPDPSAIGRAVPPPFAVLPRPGELFVNRAARFVTLSQSHQLGPFLRFLGEIADAQNRVTSAMPPPRPLAPERLERSRANAMPPIDGDEISRDPEVHDTVRRFFAEAADIGMPPAASEALQRAASRPEAEQTVALRQLFAAEEDHVGLAEQAFVAAGLQVHLSALAASLESRGLVEIGPGICPACGGRPVGSVVAGWQGAENARYCACSLCGTLWNFVRVKCTHCGSTEGIGYRHVEESGEAIKAECCDKCHGYSKVLYTVTDPALEPFADDVASLSLDLLMQDEPYRRTAFNPFLIR